MLFSRKTSKINNLSFNIKVWCASSKEMMTLSINSVFASGYTVNAQCGIKNLLVVS